MPNLILNRTAEYRQALPDSTDYLNEIAAERMLDKLALCPLYKQTPLRHLSTKAQEFGIAELAMKDEAARFGLGSFKALGGVNAVLELALERARARQGYSIGFVELFTPSMRAMAADTTFVCATDGNHGKSVAFGATLIGAKSLVFVHTGTSEARVDAIRTLGADVRIVRGNYEAAVSAAKASALETGSVLVSDTSWPGYESIPKLVMEGYLALISEALSQMKRPPTHVFVQAGVGGLAAAVSGHLVHRFKTDKPFIVIVEPSNASCLFTSNLEGKRVAIRQERSTVMAMLECYEPSMIAWDILAKSADAFLTIDDSDAIDAMNVLARPVGGDPMIISGESGAAGFAGLRSIISTKGLRQEIGLDETSRVLIFNTEGATDGAIFKRLTGMEPELAVRT